jgi:hypothetical protein
VARFILLYLARNGNASRYRSSSARLCEQSRNEVAIYILYGTSACHLCELAEDLLQARPEGERVAYEKCDISESDELFARYGLTIPVLASPDGRELCWPFTASQLQQFLRS